MGSEKNISFTQLTTNPEVVRVEAALGQMTLDLTEKGVSSDVIARKCLDYGFMFAEADNIHDPVKVTTWMAIIDEVYERTKQLRERFDEVYSDDRPGE